MPPPSKLALALIKDAKKIQKRMKKKRKPPTSTTAIAPVSYSSGLNLFADRYIGKLKWVKTFTFIPPATDVPNFMAFNMAGLYDPEVAISSSFQPTNFDQLMAYYEHYRVLGATMKATCYHSAGSAMVVGVIQSPDTTTPIASTRDGLMIDPASTYRLIGNDRPYALIKKSFSSKKVWGRDAVDRVHVGDETANPTDSTFFHFWSVNHAPGYAQAAFSVTIEIDFTAEFLERKTVAKS